MSTPQSSDQERVQEDLTEVIPVENVTTSGAPADVSEEQPAPGQFSPSSRHNVWGRIGVLATMAAVFGVLGWIAGPPRTTKAAQRNEQSLRDTTRQLGEVALAKAKLQDQLKEAGGKVEDLTAQLSSSQQMQTAQQQTLQQYQTKAEQAEQTLAALRTAQEPLVQQVEQAQQLATLKQQEAAVATKAAEEFSAQLNQADEQRENLSQDYETARQEKVQLTDELHQQKQTAQQLTALLECLEVQKGHLKTARKASPAEPPVTAKELISAMGTPAMTSEKDRVVRLAWSQHSADVRGGVVEVLDGRPCSRRQLLASGARLPEALPPAEGYRLSKGGSLLYSDMVGLFGKPEAVEGTGRGFTASWAIGAWSRLATATVLDGVVTKFDNRDVDPEEICQLVRQRLAAYPNKVEATQRLCTASEGFYNEAKKWIAQELQRDMSIQRREGLTLKSWSIGDFNSVNTWIAPTTFGPEAMTMRTTLDCTWEAAGGKTTTTRQYAVVTLSLQGAQPTPIECAIFQGRD
jgi:hypothetical protein